MKIIIVSIIVIAATIYGSLFIDDDLNPEIVTLKKQYDRPTDLNSNVYIELIRLGSNMSYNEALNLYHSRLTKAIKNPTKSGSEFIYPNITDLTSHEELKNICKLKIKECQEEIKNNKMKYFDIVNKYEVTLLNYRRLLELKSFDPINSFYSEPNFEFLAKLNKLAAVEIYIDILNHENQAAIAKLISMIELDRKFMATSHEFIFDVLFIVNMSERYTPLILALKENRSLNLNKLLPVLAPLSADELSMNRYFIANFTHGTELIKLAKIVGNEHKNSSGMDMLFAQLSYKENMTMNADYEFLKRNLIPNDIDKAELLEFFELRKKQVDSAFDSLTEKPWYSIEKLRNPVGEMMLEIGLPKFVHIFEDKIGLDLTLILTRMLIQSSELDLNEITKNETNLNPYKSEKAFFNQDGLLCFSTSKEVCIKVT
jgi:hypothetical protein